MGVDERVAQAFSRHDFGVAYGVLDADVRWELVGARVIAGREAVVAMCEESVASMRGVRTEFLEFRTVVGADVVVVDSVAEYTAGDGAVSRVASCDLYTFGAGTLTEIRSYNVELQ